MPFSHLEESYFVHEPGHSMTGGAFPDKYVKQFKTWITDALNNYRTATEARSRVMSKLRAAFDEKSDDERTIAEVKQVISDAKFLRLTSLKFISSSKRIFELGDMLVQHTNEQREFSKRLHEMGPEIADEFFQLHMKLSEKLQRNPNLITNAEDEAESEESMINRLEKLLKEKIEKENAEKVQADKEAHHAEISKAVDAAFPEKVEAPIQLPMSAAAEEAAMQEHMREQNEPPPLDLSIGPAPYHAPPAIGHYFGKWSS